MRDVGRREGVGGGLRQRDAHNMLFLLQRGSASRKGVWEVKCQEDFSYEDKQGG